MHFAQELVLAGRLTKGDHCETSVSFYSVKFIDILLQAKWNSLYLCQLELFFNSVGCILRFLSFLCFLRFHSFRCFLLVLHGS